MGMRLGSFLGVTSLQSHLTRNESYISIQSVCSASGGSSVDGQAPDPTPGRASFAQHLSRLDQRTEDTDDLYRWMQRQQDFTKTAYYSSTAGMPETFTKHKGSEQSIDELPSEHSLAATLVPTAFQPVAAQVCHVVEYTYILWSERSQCSDRNRQHFKILLFLLCPELKTSELKCLVYNENTHIYDTVCLGKRTEGGYKTF